jgi:hypothetical protein
VKEERKKKERKRKRKRKDERREDGEWGRRSLVSWCKNKRGVVSA